MSPGTRLRDIDPARAVARPSRAALEAARGREVPDLIAPGLRVLFCGITARLYSAVVGHHFARPGNRFWPTLHGAGFTERLLSPNEERELLARGIGITNVHPKASASADSLSRDDYRSGAVALRRTVRRYRPGVIAFVGLGAYRLAAGEPRAVVGPQPSPFAGVAVWALPNPSGLNAHYQLDALVRCYRALRAAVMSP